MTVTPRDRLIAGYAALAIGMHVLEAAIPSPLPGAKPGLANVITLIALLRHGWGVAAWVTGLRVVAGSLLIGTFLTPAFWLSAGGALASVGALALGDAWNRARPGLGLSALGLAVLSAMAHMAGQFAVARSWLVPHPDLLRLLPPLMLLALLFGLVSGMATRRVLARLPALPLPAGP